MGRPRPPKFSPADAGSMRVVPFLRPLGTPLGPHWGHLGVILACIFASGGHPGSILVFHLASELNFGSIFARMWPLEASEHPMWGRRNARSVPPPHRRWRRVLNPKSKSWPNIFKPKMLSFKILGLDLRITPSLSLPRATHIPPGRPKIDDVSQSFWFWGLQILIFSPSKTHFKNDIEKTWKKVRKSRIWASQNHPKILPKCLRKRCPNRHVIFHRFLPDFGCLSQRPTLDFCWQGHSFVSFLHNSRFRLLYPFSVRKTYRKPFQNEARTLKKSMPKTYWFFTSIFSRLGLELGASWASNLEPSPPRCLQRQAC